MAILEKGKNLVLKKTDDIVSALSEEGVLYERWELRDGSNDQPENLLSLYSEEIEKLKSRRHYLEADFVSLNSQTPRLDEICNQFKKEHYHDDDEVRFVVAGSGVFEVLSKDHQHMLKITTVPGDLIVIPAKRPHLFYLTPENKISCIRLFKNPEGWKAHFTAELQPQV